MNCYYHPGHDAVAQCADCGKGLCRSCATRFTIPICPECNGVRRRSELRGCIVPLLLCGLLFAIGYNSEFMGPDRLFGAYMLMSVYGGWKFINRFCPFVFVWFSVEAIFWYFLIKVALSMLIGFFVTPVYLGVLRLADLAVGVLRSDPGRRRSIAEEASGRFRVGLCG